MNVRDTDFGKTIRTLRETRGMTRLELSEAARISESHLKKIEAGSRRPGIDTYQKLIDVLGVDIVIQDEEKTVKGSCVAKIQEILMNSTEEQALFMTGLLEFVAQNMRAVL